MGSNGVMINPQYYWSEFGDTTQTKVFVGGLAWETPTEGLRRYFEQFGEILEAVIITDKNTGRSKGYGFVTFREPESARRSVVDPNPLINGRRANCNIAALGRAGPSPQIGRNQGTEKGFPDRQRTSGPPYTGVPAQMPSVMYPTPYGYMTYGTEYGYQQGVYNPELAMQYYQHMMMYGSTPSSVVGAPAYQYHQHPEMSYIMQSSRNSIQPSTLQGHVHHQPYEKDPTAIKDAEGSLFSPGSLPHDFQLHAPPQARKSATTSGI